jgi:hypothetical protein
MTPSNPKRLPALLIPAPDAGAAVLEADVAPPVVLPAAAPLVAPPAEAEDALIALALDKATDEE